MTNLALALLSLVPQVSGGTSPTPAPDPSPVVLRVDGHDVSRQRYGDWLLRSLGETLAPAYGELVALRRLGEAAGIVLEREEFRGRARAEFEKRIQGAFGGDTDRWRRELEQEGRTEAGRLEERALELEVYELLEQLAARREVAPDELRAELAREREVLVLPAIQPDLAEPPLPPGTPVLRVDGQDVPREQYADWLATTRGEIYARRFALEHRVLREAAAADITVTPEDVRARVVEERERAIDFNHGGDRGRWLDELDRNGLDEGAWYRVTLWRARLEARVDRLVLRLRQITEADLRTAWENEYGPGGRAVELRWIELHPDLPDGGSSRDEAWQKAVAEALEATRQEALGLRRRLVDDGEDFSILAKRHSDDQATARRGGRPPAGFRTSQLPPEVREAVSVLEPGEISQPIVTGIEVFLIELLGKQETPFAEVRDSLEQRLRTRRADEIELAAYKNLLAGQVQVEILPALFRPR